MLKNGNQHQSMMYRVHHLSQFADEFRNYCAGRIHELISPFAQWCGSPQIFAQNEQNLREIIESLPSEELVPGSLVTRERIGRIYSLWNDAYLARPASRRAQVHPDSQWRRFSLHLNGWLSYEEFLKSDCEVLIKFENDIEIPDSFVEQIDSVLRQLPTEWDFFNFIVPEAFKAKFQEFMQLPGTNLAINFQNYPAACLLISRSGAKKLLRRMLIDSLEIPPWNGNADLSGDYCFHNITYLPPFDQSYVNLHIDYSINRKFHTYTFIPNVETGLFWREGKSTWA